MEEEQMSVLMHYPTVRTGLCATVRGNLAASLPQADESVGMKSFVRVKEIPCDSWSLGRKGQP